MGAESYKPRSGGRASIEIGAVSRSTEIDSHGRGNLAALVDGRGLTIHGWVVGDERTATDVEVLCGDEVLVRMPVALERPDVVEELGQLAAAAHSGFMLTLRPRRSQSGELEVRAIFDEGAPVRLGRIEVEAELEGAAGEEAGSAWSYWQSPAGIEQVLVGREGWLFLRGDSNDAIGQHSGRVRFSARDKEALGALFERRMEAVEAAGTTWLTAVIPDKEILYSEHLPAEIVQAPRRPVHDFLEVARRAEAPTLYLLDDLRGAKPDGDLYMRNDTHWNHRGAFVAYAAICHRLAELGVELDVVGEGSIEWWEAAYPGDLGEKLPNFAGGRDLRATLDPCWGDRTYDNEIRNHGRVMIHEQRRAEGPTCLVFGESFAETLLFFLKESFRRVVFAHTSMFVGELVDLERPDVVLSLPIERFLIHVPDDGDALASLAATAGAKGGELPWAPDRSAERG